MVMTINHKSAHILVEWSKGEGNNMATCKTCKYCKIVFLWLRGRYLRNKQDFCALHKKLISNDGCCEMWQARKTEYNLAEIKANSALEDCNIVIWNLEEI